MKFTATTTTTNDLVFKLEEKSKHIYYIEKKEENKNRIRQQHRDKAVTHNIHFQSSSVD